MGGACTPLRVPVHVINMLGHKMFWHATFRRVHDAMALVAIVPEPPDRRCYIFIFIFFNVRCSRCSGTERGGLFCLSTSLHRVVTGQI